MFIDRNNNITLPLPKEKLEPILSFIDIIEKNYSTSPEQIVICEEAKKVIKDNNSKEGILIVCRKLEIMGAEIEKQSQKTPSVFPKGTVKETIKTLLKMIFSGGTIS